MKITQHKLSMKPVTAALLLLSLSTNVNAGILPSCFSSTEYKPISEQRLQARVRDEKGLAFNCYTSALCLAKAEKLLDTEQFDEVLRTTTSDPASSYTPEFQAIMDLDNPNNLKTSLGGNDIDSLNPADISESGFINFKRQGGDGHYYHTAYVQVTAKGEKFLYSVNAADLEHLIINQGSDFIQLGTTMRFRLDETTISAFNQYLTGNGTVTAPQFAFKFTPAEDAAARVGGFGNGV